MNPADKITERHEGRKRFRDEPIEPSPVSVGWPLWLSLIIAVIFGVLLGYIAVQIYSILSFPSTGAAVDKSVAPFVVGQFYPSDRWARLRERCRLEVA